MGSEMCIRDSFDTKRVNKTIKIGDRKVLLATLEGKLCGTVIQKDGSTQDITLGKVHYVPELYCNLFSITQALQTGCVFSSTKNKTIRLTRGKINIDFDRTINTPGGFLLGVKI